MSYLDHDGLAYFKSKLDRTFIADIVFDDGDILLYGGDGTLLKTVVQEGTVTQKKSTTNKEYPILLCWDADAEEDQTMKTVWYGLDARINPKFGYLYARRYYTEHPSYERTSVPSTRAEWHHMFTDAVSAPMGEVYEYLDRNSDGGEHRMELRLYGNPLSQYVDTPNHNEATDAVSIGVGATRGDTLTFFGYCPSTPIYLENGTTMRKSLVRGDQYGKDIITRDWLNLNGSITGLVHTYMDETIDGYKTFLKTVTIDSGNDNAKAGLNVQGDVNIDSGDNTKPSNLYVQGNSHIHGNEDIDGNLNVDGTSTLDGNVHMKHNLDVDGNLNVDGTSDQHGNVHMYNNLDVDGNANTDGNQTIGGTLTVTGKITGNGGAAISGGNGLQVTGNETISGNLTVGGTTTTEDLSVTDDATIGDDLTVNGDANVAGTINKKSGNTTQEYVTYVVNQNDTRKNIAAGLVDTTKGLAYNATTGKISVNAGDGLAFKSNGSVFVDFDQMPTEQFEALLNQLHLPLWVGERNGDSVIGTDFYVNGSTGINKTEDAYGRSADKPWKTIAYATQTLAKNYNINNKTVHIYVAAGTYNETITLPLLQRTTGKVVIAPINSSAVVKVEHNDVSQGASIFNHSGGLWELHHLQLKLTLEPQTDGTLNFPHIIFSSDNSGGVTVKNCNMSFVDNSVASDSSHGAYTARLIASAGGNIILINNGMYSEDTVASRTCTFSGTRTNAYVIWLYLEQLGRITFFRSGTTHAKSTINVTGSFSYFCSCNSNSQYGLNGTGDDPEFSYTVSSIGRGSHAYSARTGGTVVTGKSSTSDRDNYFPHGYEDVENSTNPASNTIITSEGSWVSPMS